MLIDEIKTKILAVLPDAAITIESEDGVHFQAVVVSDSFANQRLVQRQQTVMAALSELFQQGQLHALGLKTYTQQEWNQQ